MDSFKPIKTIIDMDPLEENLEIQNIFRTELQSALSMSYVSLTCTIYIDQEIL